MPKKRALDLSVVEDDAWRLLKEFFRERGLSFADAMTVMRGLHLRLSLEKYDVLAKAKFE